jgi:NAD(P) transhydrogenase
MNMPNDHYDLIVIGSGPAGEKGAAQAAQAGKRVAMIERSANVGGAGINGTVPSKTLREAALYFSGLRQRGLFGIDYALKENISVKDFMQREQVAVENEQKIIEGNIQRHNITLMHGEASFKDAHTVLVHSSDGETQISGEIILIATGSAPYNPPEIPVDGKLVYDSDSILQMTRIPKTMAIVGAGVIGTEYASLFAALGVQVKLIEPRERVLPFVDTEMIHRLRDQLLSLGVKFALGSKVTAVALQGDHIQLTVDREKVMQFDVALIATGRQGNVRSLGLDKIGVEVDERGIIAIDERYQTSVPNIYAAGDVVGFPALASASMEQGMVAMVNAFDDKSKKKMSDVLPLSIYAIPEISMVGLTEDECMAKQIPYVVGRGYFKNNPRGQIIGDMSGMIKLVFSPHNKKLFGVHIIGEQASELIHIGAHVMIAGSTVDAFIQAIYNYPTLAGLYKDAALDGLKNLETWRASTT